MDDLSTFCCQNPDCPDYGLRGQNNLRVAFRYGNHEQRRMLACRSCRHRFSERKGTPLFDTRLPEDQARAVLQHLQDGCGVRQTGRLVGVKQDTVSRLGRLAGSQSHQHHDEFAAFSPGDPGSRVR
jgi:transposase-like protein